MIPMKDPVLNTPRNPWYQKQYHRRLPRKAESQWWLDAAYTLVGGDDGGGIITPPASDPDHIIWTDNSRLSEVTLITPSPATLTWSADVGGGVPGIILSTGGLAGSTQRAYMQWNNHFEDGLYQYLHLLRGTLPSGTTKRDALPFARAAFNAGKTAMDRGYLVGPRCVTVIADRFNISEVNAGVEAVIGPFDLNRAGTFGVWRWTELLIAGSYIAIRSYPLGTTTGPTMAWVDVTDETQISGMFGCGYQQGATDNTLAIAEMIYTPNTPQKVLIEGELAAYSGLDGPHIVTVTSNMAAWKS